MHKGHISFAFSAIETAQLDEVYFLPEILPRRKLGITHIGHRIAMLKLATRAHPKLKLLELPDKRFTVSATLPRLISHFPDDQLFLMMGSDVLMHFDRWANIQELLNHVGLIVSVRSGSEVSTAMGVATNLPRVLRELHIVESLAPTISSRQVRQAFHNGQSTDDVLFSVEAYTRKHWLYASVADSMA